MFLLQISSFIGWLKTFAVLIKTILASYLQLSLCKHANIDQINTVHFKNNVVRNHKTFSHHSNYIQNPKNLVFHILCFFSNKSHASKNIVQCIFSDTSIGNFWITLTNSEKWFFYKVIIEILSTIQILFQEMNKYFIFGDDVQFVQMLLLFSPKSVIIFKTKWNRVQMLSEER